MNCGVCLEAPRKYKCPSCRLGYCSAVCYKVHREIPCTSDHVVEEKISKNQFPEPTNAETMEEIEDDVPLLTKDQLAMLSMSEKIQKALKDPSLREKITMIDQHPQRLNELQKALTDPVFARFVYGMMDEVYSVDK